MAFRPLLGAAFFALALAALSFGTSTTVGCGSTTFDAPTDSDGGGGDACTADLTKDPSNCGHCGTVCSADQACVASQCVPGCSGATIYVSTSGDDTKSGCTPATAKKTIASAISTAKTGAYVGYEIHVCAGTYPASVTLDYPISLRGSYDCATWMQSATYGFPKFDPTNQTLIAPTASPTPAAALTVNEASISASQVIDGFTFQGPVVAAGRSTGMKIVTGSPTVSNNAIAGGQGLAIASAQSAAGSTGLWILAGSPNITKNVMGGGNGTAATNTRGSIGLDVADTPTAPLIQGNFIDGGNGTAGSSVTLATVSVGALFEGGNLTGTHAVSGNTISGGSGTGSNAGELAVFGTEIAGATVDLIANALGGGSVACVNCTTVAVQAVHIEAPASAHVAIVDNRIYGGDIDPTTPSGGIAGVDAEVNTQLLITDNMIHAGNGVARASHAGFGVEGLLLANGDKAVIEHNTIALGNTWGRALDLGVGETGAYVEDNLFVGALGATGNDDAIFFSQCASGQVPIASLQNNGVVAFSGVPLHIGNASSPCNAGVFTTISKMETEINGESGQAASNFTIGPPCGVQPATQCAFFPQCDLAGAGTYQMCMASFFMDWDQATFGAATLTNGWHLQNLTPLCPLTKPSATVSLTVGVASDHYGNPFAATRPSLGGEQIAVPACL